MPTGYTAGILDGKINDFPEFAKNCMRAFGATIHMKEESLDKVYTPRTPSKFYKQRITSLKKVLKENETLSDKEIIKSEKKFLTIDKVQLTKNLEEKKVNVSKLKMILKDVIKWTPPNIHYKEFKDFMIQQLTSTIDSDGNGSYYVNEIKKVNERLKNIDPNKIRKERFEKYNKDLIYYTNQYNEELEHCKDSNTWVSTLVESLYKD